MCAPFTPRSPISSEFPHDPLSECVCVYVQHSARLSFFFSSLNIDWVSVWTLELSNTFLHVHFYIHRHTAHGILHTDTSAIHMLCRTWINNGKCGQNVSYCVGHGARVSYPPHTRYLRRWFQCSLTQSLPIGVNFSFSARVGSIEGPIRVHVDTYCHISWITADSCIWISFTAKVKIENNWIELNWLLKQTIWMRIEGHLSKHIVHRLHVPSEEIWMEKWKQKNRIRWMHYCWNT